jgi:hypothetical protein
LRRESGRAVVMSVRRESFFECTHTSRGGIRVAIVRAWDAADAAESFRDLLAAEGVRARGRVAVRPVHGRLSRPSPEASLASP